VAPAEAVPTVTSPVPEGSSQGLAKAALVPSTAHSVPAQMCVRGYTFEEGGRVAQSPERQQRLTGLGPNVVLQRATSKPCVARFSARTIAPACLEATVSQDSMKVVYCGQESLSV